MVVAGRVDVVKLAEIMAGLTADKFNIRTLSLLLSYCVEISHSAMEQNSLLTTRFDGPLKAFNFLSDVGILSRHVQVRNMKKMKMAQGLDEIRQMGGIPSIDAPDVYNTLHNRHSTQVPDTHIITKSKVDEAVKVFKDLEAQELIDKSKAPRVIHGNYNLDENGAIIPKHKVIPKLECPIPATDIPDEAATEKPDFKKQGLAKYQAWKLEQQRKQFEEKQARTSKGASEPLQTKPKQKDSDIPRPQTNEEITASFDRIAKKDKEQAMLDMSKPVN
jgi:hypothetical protein